MDQKSQNIFLFHLEFEPLASGLIVWHASNPKLSTCQMRKLSPSLVYDPWAKATFSHQAMRNPSSHDCFISAVTFASTEVALVIKVTKLSSTSIPESRQLPKNPNFICQITVTANGSQVAEVVRSHLFRSVLRNSLLL